MNQYETVQDLIAHLSSLPTEVKNGPVLIPKGAPDSTEFYGLSGASFMYVDRDRNLENGATTDEVWDEDDLVGSEESAEEAKEILRKFRKVLVLWAE